MARIAEATIGKVWMVTEGSVIPPNSNTRRGSLPSDINETEEVTK
jgi:hypothetical protein